jgi:hypothetical protein
MFRVLVLGGVALVACGGLEAAAPMPAASDGGEPVDVEATLDGSGSASSSTIGAGAPDATISPSSLDVDAAHLVTAAIDASLSADAQASSADAAADVGEDRLFPTEGPPR